ncbi:MAG: AbrB/MazE/SpoVT family DNA-binding domain-containing protein [Chloroflexi bacterium]|nr:AbrB/MazE/SpoVT family DNA-binding domain-containing protein [Chloroflexota bacterium]
MKTTITQRGQTVIPAELRRKYRLLEGDQIEWLDTGSGLRVLPVPRDPVAALRGSGRGQSLLTRLLQARAQDRERE